MKILDIQLLNHNATFNLIMLLEFIYNDEQVSKRPKDEYRQVSNIRRILVGN